VLTDVLAEKRGTRPKSYRAGRWGFSAAHIEALLDLGYVADCSVTPLVSWADAGAKERGQDFREAPVRPYYVASGDAGREGASGLVELPVIQMTFHSSELMPGGSPHNPTSADVATLLAKLGAVFQRLAGDGVTGATLTSYAEAFRAGHPR